MDLRPQALVSVAQAEGGSHLVVRLVQRATRGRGDVQHVAREVLDRDVDVHPPLPLGQRHVDLARLRVHEVCLERLAVAQQQRVGERAVAPVDAAAMELHEQAGHGIEEPLAIVPGGLRQSPEQSPQLERPGQVAGDDDRGVVVRALHQPDRPHRRRVPLLQLAHHVVLAARGSHRQLLERQQLRVEGDEADHVATLADGQLHEARRVGRPLVQGHGPGQLQQGRCVATEPHQDAGSGLGNGHVCRIVAEDRPRRHVRSRTRNGDTMVSSTFRDHVE